MENFMNIINFLLSLPRNTFRFLFFEYKQDDSVRNLYIENAKKLKIIYQNYFASMRVDDNTRNLLFEIYDEASLYLHRDVVTHIEKVKSLMFEDMSLNASLNGIKDVNKKEELINRLHIISNEINELSKEYLQVYRNHILQDGFLCKVKGCFDETKKELQKVEEIVK